MTEDELNANYRCVFVRNLKLDASIGVLASEETTLQPVRLNIKAWIDAPAPSNDSLEAVYDYRRLVRAARDVFEQGHIGLQETAVERIATQLLTDTGVRAVFVCSEKLAIDPTVESYGVQILKERT